MAKKPKDTSRCEWITLQQALAAFANAPDGTQGSGHIRPLHWYVACRLVLEGGFFPEDITPRPPFRVEKENTRHPVLVFDSTVAGSGERSIIGGLKAKAIDTVVAKEGIGPCIAVSMKGTLNAFRNLTNRMEEAVGDCTNIHITYPALVYGFLHVIRATKPGDIPSVASHFLKPGKDGRSVRSNDVALTPEGEVSDALSRYIDVLARLTGRADIRDDPTRYEAVSLLFVEGDGDAVGTTLPTHPDSESPLRFRSFFEALYRQYDLRFDYSGASTIVRTTRRRVWRKTSPVFSDPRATEYACRHD